MKRGRKPVLEDQIQGLCVYCNINKQMPAPRSSLGFRLYTPGCSTCNKKKYNVPRRPYRQNKKPHCERCGFVAIDTCQLDIHHKDRNNKNHDAFNLETLCSNCHRLEHKEDRKIWGALG